MSANLANVGKLDSLSMRRASITERLAAASPEHATHMLDSLLADAVSGLGPAADAALAVATWIARSDRPDVWCEGRRLRGNPDPLLARLRAAVTEATPLASHVLLQPGPKMSPLGRWADGVSIDFFLHRRLQLRGASAWLRLQAILNEPRLRPRFVVAMASTRPLPPEVAFAIALHDTWISRTDVRAALVYNQTAPAALVAPLLATVGPRIVQIVAERAHEPTVLAAAAVLRRLT